MSVHLIGDIHGRKHEYLKYVDEFPFTLQVGDLDISRYEYLKKVNAAHHKIVPGNHEHYRHLKRFNHFLRDYGFASLNDVKFFFVRGADSWDKVHRTSGVNWFAEEEISYSGLNRALSDYMQDPPDIVISHCAPAQIAQVLCRPYKSQESLTETALQEMFDFHRPKAWFHGHYHKSNELGVRGCRFRCIAPGEVLELFSDGSYVPVYGRTHCTHCHSLKYEDKCPRGCH